MECSVCDKKNANYRCSECGAWYCKECAWEIDEVCPMCNPPTIKEVEKKKGE